MDDASSTCSERAGPPVDLGFVEPPAGFTLHRTFFPSKVGGKPAWLDPENVPERDQLVCANCGQAMIFLLQLYAPVDDLEEAFHRTLYVFCCPDGKCLKEHLGGEGCLAVLRAQLPRRNAFYPSEPPREDEAPATLGETMYNCTHFCTVCGVGATKKCSACKCAWYCCEAHQQADWKAAHKGECATLQAAPQTALAPRSLPAIVLPEWEIVIEPEDDDGASDAGGTASDAGEGSSATTEATASDATDATAVVGEKEAELLQRYQQERAGVSKKEAAQMDRDVDEVFASAEENEDEVFAAFQARVADNKGQVVRYCRHPGAKPLWIGSEGQAGAVPPCAACGGLRTFECQVMPQILNHLGLDKLEDSVDWGVLAVYTCDASCSSAPYVPEYVWRQPV